MYRGTHPRDRKHTCASCTPTKPAAYTGILQKPQEPPAKKPRFTKPEVRPQPRSTPTFKALI